MIGCEVKRSIVIQTEVSHGHIGGVTTWLAWGTILTPNLITGWSMCTQMQYVKA